MYLLPSAVVCRIELFNNEPQFPLLVTLLVMLMNSLWHLDADK